MEKQTSDKGDAILNCLISGKISIFDRLDLEAIGITQLTKADLLRVIEKMNDLAIDSLDNWL